MGNGHPGALHFVPRRPADLNEVFFLHSLTWWRAPIRGEQIVPEVPISRPTPPRTEDYAFVPGSQGPRRDFRISVGLLEGWGR